MRITNTPLKSQYFHISTTLTLSDFLPLCTCSSILLMASALRTTCFPNFANRYHGCFISSLLLFQPSYKLYDKQLFLSVLFSTACLNVSLPTTTAGTVLHDVYRSATDLLACCMLSPLTIWGRSGTSFRIGVASNGGGWSAIMSENLSWTTAHTNHLLQQKASVSIRCLSPLPQRILYSICQTWYQWFRRKIRQCLQDTFFFFSTKQSLAPCY